MNTSPLVKAQILAKEVDVNLSVCFNPKELQVEKTATWESVSQVQDEPRGRFGPTSLATLAVTLLFDTYEEKNRSTKSTSSSSRSSRSSFTSSAIRSSARRCVCSYGASSAFPESSSPYPRSTRCSSPMGRRCAARSR